MVERRARVAAERFCALVDGRAAAGERLGFVRERAGIVAGKGQTALQLGDRMIPGMGGGMDPRQMAMMMKKLGIDVKDIQGVQEVVVRTATKDYVFAKASVSVMKAQGVETWQISGNPTVVEKGSTLGSASGATASSPGTQSIGSPATGPSSVKSMANRSTPTPTTSSTAGGAASEVHVSIDPEDVKLVMKEAGCNEAKAREALKATDGDLAEAILRLS